VSMILDTLDTYLLIKALHLIFVITWFAGLFYIPRLFVYHIEALDKPAAAQAYIVPQLQLMTRRLWNIITWPSAILATGFALWLLYLQPIFLTQGWMHLKLFFVVLYGYTTSNATKWCANSNAAKYAPATPPPSCAFGMKAPPSYYSPSSF